jgi:hypothetical protein
MPANDDVRVICGYRLGNGSGRYCDARVSWEASDEDASVRIGCCKRHLYGVLSDNPTMIYIGRIYRNGDVVWYVRWDEASIGSRVYALMEARNGGPWVPPPPPQPPCAKMNELPQECAGDDCAICFTQMFEDDAGELTACAHQFHTACVNRWLGTNKTTCPMCRVAIQRR